MAPCIEVPWHTRNTGTHTTLNRECANDILLSAEVHRVTGRMAGGWTLSSPSTPSSSQTGRCCTRCSGRRIKYTTAPRISNITIKVVSQGFDKADDYIAENAQGGDLIITADIPLAARCIEKDCMVLTPRGKVLDHNNIGPIHSARNFNEELRNSGIQTKGPASFTKKDIQKFANALDRWVQKNSAS